jgi:hypothetical protein
MIELKINERTYYLYIGDDFINIENACGGLQLARDDDIAKIVEKYIKNPEDSSVGTIIETEHSTYDEAEFITKEKAVSIAVDEAKKDKYDYQGWDSDFYFNDSEANTPILTSDKTYGNGFWVKEWHNEKNGSLKPENVTANTTKKVWWICHKGHEWQATIASRNRNHGCPYCAGRYAAACATGKPAANRTE